MPHAAWTHLPSIVAALGLLVTTPACGTSAASGAASSQAPSNAVQQAQAAPPHVFTPRVHPARVHERPPAPDLASLPPMVDRSAACFGWAVEQPATWSKPPPTRRHKKKSKKKDSRRPPGYVPYGGSGRGGGGKAAEPKKSRTRPTKSKSSRKRGRSGGSPGGVVGGVQGGSLGGAAGAVAPANDPAPAPSLPPAVQPSVHAEPSPAPASVEVQNNRLDDGFSPADRGLPPAIATGPAEFEDWGAALYLSNDDTMSLSSAQRVIYAIDNMLPLPAEHIRPHELLNYFSFDTASVPATSDFSVAASIAPDPEQDGIYSLAMAVRGRPMGVSERRNTNLSVVIDRSGSMSADGRMEYLKRGLRQMTDQLKTGDMLHLTLFDHSVCVPIENFVVGRDSPATLLAAIDALEPRGSTDLHDGLRKGYQLADHAYQPTYSNRVVMVTDAIANTGVTDEQMISTVSKFYDERRIRLSGVGVGRDFNDALLDKLTERGKGAYVFLGSEAEVDAVFGPRFVSLIETTALDVHFRLHLPPSLRMNVFYGEESSAVKQDVQAIHYFANTSQLFLSDLMARGGQLRPQDSVMLTVEYEDPETGEDMVEEYAFTLSEIEQRSLNIRKGRLIMRFVDGLSWMASHPGAGPDAQGWAACEEGRKDLTRMAEGIQGDAEVTRVMGLWDRYCTRYTEPRPRDRPPANDSWPSAGGR